MTFIPQFSDNGNILYLVGCVFKTAFANSKLPHNTEFVNTIIDTYWGFRTKLNFNCSIL